MIWGVILLIAILVTLYYAFALLFHWFRYGSNLPLVWLALPVYLAGVGFLFLIALTAFASLP